MRLFLQNLFFSLLVPGTVAVYVPRLIVQGRMPGSEWAATLSVPVFAAGASIYIWCVWDFAAFGRGTPAPMEAPRRLVARGLYRYSRNPMYVGVLTVILGWALLYQSARVLLYAMLVGTAFHLVVILYEERHLHRTFGEEYDAYRKRVGRWLPTTRPTAH